LSMTSRRTKKLVTKLICRKCIYNF
jgi:hypothetical protein